LLIESEKVIPGFKARCYWEGNVCDTRESDVRGEYLAENAKIFSNQKIGYLLIVMLNPLNFHGQANISCSMK
jgi:hypothetical protein